ncbi:MAG: hypothetical protein AB1568_05220 [Thermodesulfobacteriota bacterium]
MKKTVLAATVLAALTFAGYQSATAGRAMHMGGPMLMQNQPENSDPAAEAAQRAFFRETVETRRAIANKRIDLMQEMNAEKVDEEKVKALRLELLDLHQSLQRKAVEAGLDAGLGGPMTAGKGCGMGGPGGCRNCPQRPDADQ